MTQIEIGQKIKIYGGLIDSPKDVDQSVVVTDLDDNSMQLDGIYWVSRWRMRSIVG